MNENAYMAEFAENLWNNYIKLKIADELQQNVSYYKATVVSNPGDGTLSVQRPYDSAYIIRCIDDLKTTATAGKMVTVLVFGKGNATNHIAVSIDGLKDIRTGVVKIANGGTGATTKKGVRNTLGLGNTTGPVPIANGGTGANNAAAALTNLGIADQIIEIGDSADTGRTSSVMSGHIYWQKYESGMLRIYGYSRQSGNADISTSSWANGFEASRMTLWGTWPVPFTQPPSVNFRFVAGDTGYSGDCWFIQSPYGSDGSTPIDATTQSPWFKMWRGSSKVIGHPQFAFDATGRWK